MDAGWEQDGVRCDARAMTRGLTEVTRRSSAVYETLAMYERSFAAIGERYFKGKSWPAPRDMADLYDNDGVFGALYGELYYRHLHAETTPSANERKGAWDNYCELFGVALHGDVNMQLPNAWLWDMIDEFVYQFQSFCQFKGSGKRTAEEKSELKALDSQVWDKTSVLNFLQALVDKSDIAGVLESERKGELSFAASEGYDAQSSNVLRTLGYCAQIGICRVHALSGDFEEALKALDHIDLDRDGLFKKIPGAYITTSYHVGFSYFMLGRYTDAIRHLSEGVQYIDRLKFSSTRPQTLPLSLKRQDQMYAMIAIIMSLIPGQQYLLDDSVSLALHQKYSDKLNRMSTGEVRVFDELFSYACPKFIASATGDNEDAYKAQHARFLEAVAAHAVIPNLREFLKMYASIKLDVLSTLMEVSTDNLKVGLQAFEQGYSVKEWRGGASALDGEDVYCGDMRISLEGDVIRVEQLKKAKSAREFLQRTNEKLETALEDLAGAKPLIFKKSALAQ